MLRGFEERDLDSYAAFTADPEVMRLMGRGPFDRQGAWREMAFFLGHWWLRGDGHWALELKETGELVGRCGPYFPEGWPALEVGWLLGREHWGRGYATEAARTASRTPGTSWARIASSAWWRPAPSPRHGWRGGSAGGTRAPPRSWGSRRTCSSTRS